MAFGLLAQAAMAGESITTTNHDEIRRWVEQRGGEPARVKGTGHEEPGILCIDFPCYAGGDELEHIPWDEFLEKFDEAGLAFVYQEETTDGRVSRFHELVRCESKDNERDKRTRGRNRAA